MGLKFMQKHKAKEEAASKARAEAPSAWRPVEGRAAGRRCRRIGRRLVLRAAAAAAPAPAPAASASASTDARPPVRVIDDAAGELLASSSTLLDFRPARRSFGKFNPRLEKGLAEIESQKSALRERLAAEASAEATRAQREAAGQAGVGGARRGAASANGGRPRNGRALFQVPAGSARSGKASEAA